MKYLSKIIFLVFIFLNATFIQAETYKLEFKANLIKGSWQQVIIFDENEIRGFSNGNYQYPSLSPILLGHFQGKKIKNLNYDRKFLKELLKRLKSNEQILGKFNLHNKSKRRGIHQAKLYLNGIEIIPDFYWYKRALELFEMRWNSTEWKITKGVVIENDKQNYKVIMASKEFQKMSINCSTNQVPCFIKELGWLW